MTGRVYNIQHYSIHDGRGIRTTVFFKGCQLHCGWCANPESQSMKQELSVSAARCKECGRCGQVCENGLKPDSCTLCGRCERNCLYEARTLYGTDYTVDELTELVMKDAPFYRQSGGGVTASGGEPTLQIDFLAEFFGRLKAENVGTAIESHGCFDERAREKLLPVTDQYLLDFKHSDSETCRQFTGMGNELVYENFEELTKLGKDVWMRIPVIPGFNDDDVNMKRTAELAAKWKTPACLLKFHALASSKYASLGRKYEYADVKPPTEERMEELLKLFEAEGATVQIGG